MDVQRIFEDERRRSGAFSPGPDWVGPKSALPASTMLESGSHFLALVSWSAPISDTNAFAFPG